MKEALIDVGLREPEFGTDCFFRAVFFREPEMANTAPPKTPQVVLTKLESQIAWQ